MRTKRFQIALIDQALEMAEADDGPGEVHSAMFGHLRKLKWHILAEFSGEEINLSLCPMDVYRYDGTHLGERSDDEWLKLTFPVEALVEHANDPIEAANTLCAAIQKAAVEVAKTR